VTGGKGYHLLQICDLLAQICLAGRGVTTSRLCQDRLSAILSQPRGKRCKGAIDVVGHTLNMRTTIVRVEVLVHVKDEIIVVPSRVLTVDSAAALPGLMTAAADC
jgi:hypothetical protein